MMGKGGQSWAEFEGGGKRGAGQREAMHGNRRGVTGAVGQRASGRGASGDIRIARWPDCQIAIALKLFV